MCASTGMLVYTIPVVPTPVSFCPRPRLSFQTVQRLNPQPSHLTTTFAAPIATNGSSLIHYRRRRRRRSNPSSPTHHNPSSCNYSLYFRIRHKQIHFHLHISPSTPPPKFRPKTANNIVIIIYCAISRYSRKYCNDTLGPIAAIHASACAAGAAERASRRYGELAAYDGRAGG